MLPGSGSGSPALGASDCVPCHMGERFAYASLQRAGDTFTDDETLAKYLTFFPMISLDNPQASRLLTYRAAAIKDAMDRGEGGSTKEFKQAASVAKLYATESAVTATRIATQVFGGYGFMEEYAVARLYRDAKVLEIGEGTSEVQRMLIARGLGLPVE